MPDWNDTFYTCKHGKEIRTFYIYSERRCFHPDVEGRTYCTYTKPGMKCEKWELDPDKVWLKKYNDAYPNNQLDEIDDGDIKL